VNETHTITLPSGSKLAVEWYNRPIEVVAKPVVNRWPVAADGVYSQGVRTQYKNISGSMGIHERKRVSFTWVVGI
jgi:hypothetical protein